MTLEQEGTDTPFHETLSHTDHLGDTCPVPSCPGRLDLVYG